MDFQTINFTDLKKGQIFRFSGTKKVFEVLKRNKFDIEYFPHDNIWGDYRSTKKTSKRNVEINFTY
jgi:hypothetical protein